MNLDRALAAVTVTALIAAIVLLAQKRLSRPADALSSAYPRSYDDTVAVFVVSSTCAACKKKPGAGLVREWLDSLTSRSGSRPHVIGLSIDTNVSVGLDFLRQIGNFDEVSAGSGYMNTLALRYIWQDSIPFAGVPQLIVFRRRASVVDSPLSVSNVEDSFQRIVGLDAIANWLKIHGRRGQ